MTPQAVRPAAVAGLFYSQVPTDLDAEVRALLDATSEPGLSDSAPPKALIVPHAGYVYSGAVAATAYKRLRGLRHVISRVVLIGPAHRKWVSGMAGVSAEAFATPCGPVPVAQSALSELSDLPQVVIDDEAHAQEHSLEVHLPFLCAVLSRFEIVPLIVGGASAAEVAEVLERLWGGDETLIVVSSDLSHHHDDATARKMDAATTAAIEAFAPEGLSTEGACGARPISGLLIQAKRRGLKVVTVDVRNSGEVTGSKEQVVGYGSYVFT